MEGIILQLYQRQVIVGKVVGEPSLYEIGCRLDSVYKTEYILL